MANAFWSGFARTLNENITKRVDRAEEDASFARRKEMEMELEKKYGAEVVDRTAIVGDKEISYNKFGDPIKERILSPEELQLRRAEVDKTLADSRKSTADAGRAEFELEYADDKFELDRALTQEQIATARANRANDSERVALDRQRLQYETGGKGGLPKTVRNDVNSVYTMLEAVGNDGVNSVQGLEGAFEADLDAARLAGPEEVERVVAKWKGRLLPRFNRTQTDSTTRATGGFGLDTPLPPPTRR
jgi:hypothetical protein